MGGQAFRMVSGNSQRLNLTTEGEKGQTKNTNSRDGGRQTRAIRHVSPTIISDCRLFLALSLSEFTVNLAYEVRGG